ncbi:MAG TPA: hypothetical protein DCF45_09240 [Gammaproteobacteria bacterium]|nr:hypothetical protein [Gammaproteobacteria bacterium]
MSLLSGSTVVVTGAGGYVGRRLCSELVGRGARVRALVRNDSDYPLPIGVDCLVVGDIARINDWRPFLAGAQSVVHLAGVSTTRHVDDLREFRRVNVEPTKLLVAQCAEIKIQRFVYLSSIKVLGESSGDRPFSNSTGTNPQSAYGCSKHEAEQEVVDGSQRSQMEFVILRPAMVYGTPPTGNIKRLIKLVGAGLPLPFGGINNSRSWVSVEGLCEVICGSLYRPELAGLKLLVADPRPLSTPQTVDLIARALGKNALLIPVPVKMLRAVGRLVGRSAEISRLVSSLEVDATQTFEYFEWKPEWCFEESVDDLCAAK